MYDFNFGWEFSVPENQRGTIDMPNILASKDKGEIAIYYFYSLGLAFVIVILVTDILCSNDKMLGGISD